MVLLSTSFGDSSSAAEPAGRSSFYASAISDEPRPSFLPRNARELQSLHAHHVSGESGQNLRTSPRYARVLAQVDDLNLDLLAKTFAPREDQFCVPGFYTHAPNRMFYPRMQVKEALQIVRQQGLESLKFRLLVDLGIHGEPGRAPLHGSHGFLMNNDPAMFNELQQACRNLIDDVPDPLSPISCTEDVENIRVEDRKFLGRFYLRLIERIKYLTALNDAVKLILTSFELKNEQADSKSRLRRISEQFGLEHRHAIAMVMLADDKDLALFPKPIRDFKRDVNNATRDSELRDPNYLTGSFASAREAYRRAGYREARLRSFRASDNSMTRSLRAQSQSASGLASFIDRIGSRLKQNYRSLSLKDPETGKFRPGKALATVAAHLRPPV